MGRILRSAAQKSPPARRARPAIPSFALYGEVATPELQGLHIEPLQSRSPLYRWEIHAHQHRGLHQLVWLMAGPAGVELEGQRHDVQGPAAVLVPAGVVHGFHLAPQSDGHVLTFAPAKLLEGEASDTASALAALFAAPRVWSPGDAAAQRIQRLVAALHAEFQAGGHEINPVLTWLARAVLWRLAHDLRAAQQASADGLARSALFDRFLALVEAQHLQHWPASRYAERLGLSLERLNRLTHRHSGRAALDLVHERLAREACRRLAYVAAPVSSLAYELGFEDPAYFCRFFKRRMGCTPRQYRERAGAAV
ncbi:DNA-binding domain-containing protein, AraC-type [Burkholderiales bacterium JOSHI_001]|nr:DNA-binding domain-containing protein, AraC-type [Burkholderiales bacterium JOSHI_001]